MPGVDSFGFGANAPEATLDGFEEVHVADGSKVATSPPEDGKIEAWRKKTIPQEHAGISKYLHFDCGTSSFLRHQLRAAAIMFAFIAFCLGIVVLIGSLSPQLGKDLDWVQDGGEYPFGRRSVQSSSKGRSARQSDISQFVQFSSAYENNFAIKDQNSRSAQLSCNYYIRDMDSKLFPIGTTFVIIGFLLVLNGTLMLIFSNYGKVSSANVKWVLLVAGILMMLPGMIQTPKENRLDDEGAFTYKSCSGQNTPPNATRSEMQDDRYCTGCSQDSVYGDTVLVPVDAFASFESRSADAEKRCIDVDVTDIYRRRSSSASEGRLNGRTTAYAFYVKTMESNCTNVGGQSIASGILLWIAAFLVWFAGPEETDQELAGWQGKLWSCCSWFCAYPGMCKCWDWGCATACPVDPDFEIDDGGESGTGPSLRLPKKLAGNPPPIFIDNQPTKTTLSSNGFGKQMLTQHTMRKRSCCCSCCQSQLGAVPVDYVVADGKASNKSLVRLKGKYNIIESCSCAGLAPACSPACRNAFCLFCYKDKSTFTFGLDGKDTYTVKYGAEKDSAQYLSVESDGVTTTTVVDHTLSSCTHCKNTCCTSEYEEYPVEIKDSSGKIVLTQRIKYVGCCGPCKAMMKCQCKTCCNSCGALFGKCGCGSCCSDDCGETCCPSCSCCCGEKNEQEAKEKGEGCKCCDESGGCCGCCIEGGSCHGACQKCGCCVPKKCGGQCCERAGPCFGCGKIQWMEPFELNGAEFYGPPDDKSGKVVAKITHKMNMTKTLQCWCCTSSELSNVYHTEIDMPSNYAESEWQGLLGWNLIMDHMDLIMPMFGGALSNCLNPKGPREDKASK